MAGIERGEALLAGSTNAAGDLDYSPDEVVDPEDSPAGRDRARPGRERVAWTLSTLAVAAGSFVMGVVALWAGSWIAHTSLNSVALRWDAYWYYGVAEHGYVSALPAPVQVVTPATIHRASLRPAFFPGLPAFERVVHHLVGGPPAATILIAGAAGLAASCLLLRAMVESAFGADAAWRATVLFAFFPGAYVFVMGYSEILEIPLAILALYALRRRWYLVAGAAAGFATGTRLTAVALVAACAVAAGRELLAAVRPGRHSSESRPFRLAAALLSPLLGLCGLGGYMIYLHHRTGSYLAFQTAERIGWGNSVDLAKPYQALQQFAAHPFQVPYRTVDALGMVVAAAVVVLLATDGRRHLRLEEIVYTVVIFLIWAFTPYPGAWFRYVEAAFPVIVLLALRSGRRWYPTLVAASAFLLGILTVFFAATIAFDP